MISLIAFRIICDHSKVVQLEVVTSVRAVMVLWVCWYVVLVYFSLQMLTEATLDAQQTLAWDQFRTIYRGPSRVWVTSNASFLSILARYLQLCSNVYIPLAEFVCFYSTVIKCSFICLKIQWNCNIVKMFFLFKITFLFLDILKYTLFFWWQFSASSL